MARISLVGAGYVGLTTGVCFAHLGHDVALIDIDHEKISRLNAGDVPIFEPGLKEMIQENVVAGRLRFTENYEQGLAGAEFVFIAVGTPTAPDGHSADMRFVHAAARSIASSLAAPAVIVNKSTSPIGTADGIREIFEIHRSEFTPWRVVSNPEFLREGSAIYDCLHPNRVVLGADDRQSAEKVAHLYGGLNCPVIISDLHTAEMIKYASNAFLATKISFINEVARICDALGADVSTVAEGMGLDSRIGKEFLNAGLGYGGSCFPKDVAALTDMAAGAGLHPQLLSAVSDINVDQRRWIVDMLASHLGGLEGQEIAVLGMTFKPNTDDTRQAPALDVASRLLRAGAHVRLYDPVASSTGVEAVVVSSTMEAIDGADAVLIATEWEEFCHLNWTTAASTMRGRVVLDGRNCLDPAVIAEAGLTYVGVGRRAIQGAPRDRVLA